MFWVLLYVLLLSVCLLFWCFCLVGWFDFGGEFWMEGLGVTFLFGFWVFSKTHPPM